jgi:hypothetical protein
MIDLLPELMLYASDSLVLESCVCLVFVYNLEVSSQFLLCLELPDLSLDRMPNRLGWSMLSGKQAMLYVAISVV